MSELSLILDVHGKPLAPSKAWPPARPAAMQGYTSKEELLGDLLYYHLDCARQSAARMDRLPEWGAQYETEFSVHKAALSRAREKLRELANAGYDVPKDLVAMVAFEGLVP
jgi:hypothetical protein